MSNIWIEIGDLITFQSRYTIEDKKWVAYVARIWKGADGYTFGGEKVWRVEFVWQDSDESTYFTLSELKRLCTEPLSGYKHISSGK